MPLAKGQLGLAKNPNWKGGRVVASNGYVLVKVPEHARADSRGYVYEHRLVAEQMLGRPLRAGEIVHHRNRLKADNRPENLEIVTRRQHATEHRSAQTRARAYTLQSPGEGNAVVSCECGCGEQFPRFDYQGRSRRFVSGHNLR